MNLQLHSFCPPKFELQSWIRSPQQENTFFLLNEFDPRWQHDIWSDDEPSASTLFVNIYDIYDTDEEIIGHLVQHRPMKNVFHSNYVLNFNRARENPSTNVTEWWGEYVCLVEGDKGSVLFNCCPRNSSNIAVRRLEML